MKTFNFLIISTLIIFMAAMLNAQEINEKFNNFEGNCNSLDSTLHYDNFAFIQTGLLSYTHIFSFYCDLNIEEITDINLLKEFHQPFNTITYDTVQYSLDSIIPHLIYHKRDSLNSKNEFIIELNLPSSNNPLAYVYGSDNVAVNPNGLRVTLSYLVSLDNNNQYASSYTPQELVFNQIFNVTGSYLYEIRDIDSNNMLVGFKYFSPSTQSEIIKYIIPNN